MRQVNLFCIQGEDFSYSIQLLANTGDLYDTSGIANTVGQIRKSYISVNSVTINTVISNNAMTLSLTASQTANMVPGRYIYDVKFISTANVVSKPIAGILSVAAGATQ